MSKELLDHFGKQFDTGLPVNICYGTAEEQKRYIVDKLKAVIGADEPVGVRDDGTYLHCNSCGKVVGMGGFYCKWCGSKLREKNISERT